MALNKLSLQGGKARPLKGTRAGTCGTPSSWQWQRPWISKTGDHSLVEAVTFVELIIELEVDRLLAAQTLVATAPLAKSHTLLDVLHTPLTGGFQVSSGSSRN